MENKNHKFTSLINFPLLLSFKDKEGAFSWVYIISSRNFSLTTAITATKSPQEVVYYKINMNMINMINQYEQMHNIASYRIKNSLIFLSFILRYNKKFLDKISYDFDL